MAAPTDIYVDSDIGTNTGTGTSGDPYGNIQYAIDQTTGATRFLGTGTETLSASLSFATHGSPTFSAPCIFVANGADWILDGGAGNFAITTGDDALAFCGLELRNTGTADILQLGSYGLVESCVIHGSSGNGIESVTSRGPTVIGNHIYDVGTYGIQVASTAKVLYNYLANGATNQFVEAIRCDSGHNAGNIISITGTSKGIVLVNSIEHGAIFNNSIRQTGTGSAIELSGSIIGTLIANNVVKFLGASGTAVNANATTRYQSFIGNNAVYAPNGATAYDIADEFMANAGDNEVLAGDPFSESGSDTFANRFTFYEPRDVGNIISGGFPTASRQDKGAVQHADAGGGSTVIVVED